MHSLHQFFFEKDTSKIFIKNQ
uniref:Uncharacterized protein n=1 Tax=Strongyloides papillosus TaxID=174720 RepID=A0A0N5B394_STREA